jgi:Pleckstrin homology domain
MVSSNITLIVMWVLLFAVCEAGETLNLCCFFVKPIPLDLLTLANFTDPPQQRGTGLLRGLRGGDKHVDGAPPGPLPTANNAEAPVDSRTVFPCTIHHNGRLGGLYTLYAESAQARIEWKNKLEEALALRQAVTENNKVCWFFLIGLVNGLIYFAIGLRSRDFEF